MWNVSALGKLESVKPQVVAAFEAVNLMGSQEATIKNAAADFIAQVLSEQAPGTAIRVECEGSSNVAGTTNQQRVSILVEPAWGFVE